jgi:hypothetical protein
MPVQHRHLYDPLTNVVVFPSCGARPMPAMLAGGDLDGDIFNLLLDPRLQPPTTVAPSPPGLDVALPMRQIDHDCETEDVRTRHWLSVMSMNVCAQIADWVVDFMQVRARRRRGLRSGTDTERAARQPRRHLRASTPPRRLF